MNPLDSLFGGGLSLPSSGLLAPEDAKKLRDAAMIKAGLTIAGGTGGLFPALSQGLQAGQDEYQGGVKDALAAQQLQQNMYATALKTAKQAQLEAYRRTIPPMPDLSDHDALQKWIDTVIPMAIAHGDTEVLSSLAEIRKSLKEQAPAANEKRTGIAGGALGLDPKKTYTVSVDRQGNIVGQPMEEGVNAATQARLDIRESMTPVQQMRGIQSTEASYRQWMNKEIPVQQSWASMKLIADRAARGQGAPDDLIGLVDVMSKMYNPGAVVRVGTVQITMDKLGSWKQKLMNWKSQGLTGAPDPQLVQQIAAAAEALAAEHAKYARHIRETHIRLGMKYGVDRDEMASYLPDPWALGPAAGGIGGEQERPALPTYRFGLSQP